MKTLISILIVSLFILASCGTANVKEPQYREIREVRLIELGLLKSTAALDFIYYNPNSFGVTLSEARGDVYIDNQWLGRFELGEKITVKKRSEFLVPALIKVDMIGAVKNHREIWKKKEALIRVDGVATVRKAGFSKQVPIKYESMQNIERFRGLVSL